MVFYGRNEKGKFSSKRTLICRGKSGFFTQWQPSKGVNDTASDVYNYLNENKHDWGIRKGFNSLPDDNIFIIPNWKHFPDNKIAVNQIMGYISVRVEKHCRKRRQCFFRAFSPLPTMFSKAFFLNSFTWHANLGLIKFSRKFRNDVKNMDNWGYNYPIE